MHLAVRPVLFVPGIKYFFFTGSRGGFTTLFNKKRNAGRLYLKMHNVLNGYDNIYWMKAGKIIGAGN